MRPIRRALDALPTGRGQAIHVVGDAGVGKSELLREVIHEARQRGLCVLSSQGVASEAHLTFAGLYLLLRPILARTDSLPSVHRTALRAAFGLTDSAGPPERLFVALAALELVADAAADTPVVIAVDDLPWMDSASREAIEFVARRVEDEPTLVLLTSRSGLAGPEPVGIMLALAPLDESASEQVVRAGAPELTPSKRRAVLQAAAGNPLALVELPRAMSRPGAASMESAPWALPLTDRLQQAFAVRLDDLPPATRRALVAASLQDSDRLDETRAAIEALTGKAGVMLELEPAATAGLVRLEGERFRFRHPLVRSAVAQSASAQLRADVHLAFARSLTSAPDRAAWHRSLATGHPDETLAAELEAGADRALARGAPDVAEQWLERAAALSIAPEREGHRLVRAAELAFQLGRQTAVQDLMAQAALHPLLGPDRARLAFLEGAFDDGTPGDEQRVHRLVEGARTAGAEAEVAASLLLGAAMSSYWGAAAEDVLAHVRSGVETSPLDVADPRRMVLHALIEPFGKGRLLADQLGDWARKAVPDPAVAGALARTAFVIGDFDRAVDFAGRACEGLRQQGRVALLTQALVLQTFSALYVGRWDTTNVASAEAARFAAETHQPVWGACAQLGQANLAALHGDDARALMLAADVERTALASGNRSLVNGVQLARGFAALGAVRPDDAFRELARMFDPEDLAYHLPQSAFAIDYLAEAAVLAGREDEARATLRVFETIVDSTTATGIVRSMALARATLADPDEAEQPLEEARRVSSSATPWYRARVDLAFGSWLRRRRRVADSRGPLASAQAIFDALGADGWAQRAGRELAATGQHPRRRDPDGWARLSAQELQIVRLAAEGLSNRDIGQRLYLSHRTVASHLYRAFPKLGVSSRAQLHLALPAE